MRAILAVAAVCLAATGTGAEPAGAPPLHVTVFAHTDLPLGDVVWTGQRFLYDAENTGRLETANATGGDVQPYATLSQNGEEMRCAVPVNGYWPSGVYCHTPDDHIIRFTGPGTAPILIASLPGGGPSDGSLAFDDVGAFGYALVAATGGSASSGGNVFLVHKDGRFKQIATYPGPGGADGIAIAPRGFGSAAGSVVIAVDEDSVEGHVLAVDKQGVVSTLATGLGTGLNPIVVIRASPKVRAAGLPAAGAYLSDTTSENVFFTPASGLAPYVGDLLVGSELHGTLWVVRPAGKSFEAVQLDSDLPAVAYNLEGATYVP